jgi:hypothetical protein
MMLAADNGMSMEGNGMSMEGNGMSMEGHTLGDHTWGDAMCRSPRSHPLLYALNRSTVANSCYCMRPSSSWPTLASPAVTL